MPRRSSRGDSMDEDDAEPSRKNPRRGKKAISYSEDNNNNNPEEGDDDGDAMDVDSGAEEENPASEDEELEADDDDEEEEVVGRKSRSRRAKAAPNSDEKKEEPNRRTSSRATKFKSSMKEPSEKASDINMKETSSSTRKSNNKGASDMELEEDDDDDDSDQDQKKKPQRKTNKRGNNQKQLQKNKQKKQPPAAAPDSPRHKSPARRHKQSSRLSIGHSSTTKNNDDSDFDQSDESSDSEVDVDDEEEDEEDPFKIQRIIASRTEPRNKWAEICHGMNTAEIDYGSRWVQEDIADDDDTFEERFLVRWAGLSYMHVSWETERDLIDQVEGAKTYLSTFFRKSNHGLLFDSDERCDGDYFDPAWAQVDRILEVHFPDECPIKSVKDEDTVTNEELGIVVDKEDPGWENGLGREFLVKWGNSAYTESTFEFERDLIVNEIDYKEQLKSFIQRRKKPTNATAKNLRKEGEAVTRRLYKTAFGDKSDARTESAVEEYQQTLQKHVFKNGGQLRDYQAEGVSWLMSNYINDRSSILADEMGLGKTLQTCSFINLLATQLNRKGPFLIVAPLSTLAHWQREFMGWTGLNTVVYHGSARDRELIREYEISHESFRPTGGVGFNQLYLKKCLPKRNSNFVGNPWMAEVVITTPELITADDYLELAAVKWECLVVDEAQKLKNHNSKLANNLRDPKFDFGHKLLLTGTPIQNTMQELFALLSFVDPDQFSDCDEFMEKYGDMKSKDNLDSLHEEIRPYILRRLKEDVEKSVPPKEETVIEVELTIAQKQYYKALYEKNVKFLHKNKKKALDGPSLSNLGMQLRKCCNHLFLLNGIEEEFRAKQRKEGQKLSEGDILVKGSGKLVLLDKLLPRLKENGHRILIFSQFKIMLDVLEDYLQARTVKFERIDGSITGKKRQQAIDRFQAPSTEGKTQPFIMLLSTRAGGVGINLTAADTCIIFDSDFNPQNDLQAQARCHRIGQTKSVKVYRLLSRQTYEMQMFHMSSLKMGLDQAVLSGFEAGDGALSKEEVERLLRHGAYGIFSEDKEGAEAESNNFVQQDIDTILERRARTVVHENTGSQNSAGGTFSKARFSAPKAGEASDGAKTSKEEISINDPEFWKKMVGEGQDDDDADDLAGKRRKRNVTNYSEADYNKKMEASMLNSDAEEDDDDSDGSDDESFGSDDEGKKRERGRWGGTKPSEWKKDEAKKLISLIHAHGYGNISWNSMVKELSAKNSHSVSEVRRMCWSILLISLCEIAEEDAAQVKRRAVRAAEKKREAGDDAPNLGGVLASSQDDAATDAKMQQSIQSCFDKLWVANASWAKEVFKDALAFAASAIPRSEDALARVIDNVNNSGGAPLKKDEISMKFAQELWPSLKSRGWKAEVLTEGPNAGKTQYKYDGKQYHSMEAVLKAAGSIHSELANLVESMLSVAESSRQKTKETESKLRERHLAMKAGNVAVKDLSSFLKSYAPLQIVSDRKSHKRLHLSSRKMMHSCSFNKTATRLVERAEKTRGSLSLLDKLSTLLVVDKRITLPHPLWSSKHDAVLIHAVAKHGWIDNDASCRRITKDTEIRWGFPFDAEKSADGTEDGGGKTSRRDELINSLREAAKRAADLFNDHHDIVEDVKGFNQNLVIRAYSLVHEASEEQQASEDAETSEVRPRWVVDDVALLASTGLSSSESQELPTKKDLVKRAKMVLSRNPGSTASGAPTAAALDGSQGESQENSCALDLSDTRNLLLGELLKAIVKAPYPKSQKAIKLLCAIASEEAGKRKDSILSSISSSPSEEEKVKRTEAANDMAEAIKRIELAKRNIKATRQAKNLLRALLSLDIVKHPKDPDFPTEAPRGGIGSLQKDGALGQRQAANGAKNKKEDSTIGDRALTRAMARCFDRHGGGPGKVSPEGHPNGDLELTSIETLILTCLCSQGVPVWSDDISRHFQDDEMAVDTSAQNELTLCWTGLGKVLESAATEWYEIATKKVESCQVEYDKVEDRPDDSQAKSRARKNLAVAIRIEECKEIASSAADDYASDPQILAQKTVMLVERIRKKMGHSAGGHTKTTTKKSNHWLGNKVFDYLAEQLSLWAKNLDIVDGNNNTLSYTAADFYHDLPEAEREQVEVITTLNKSDCRQLLIQITLLTRLRSLFIKYSKAELMTRIAAAAKNCKNGDAWEAQPGWWNAGTGDESCHDTRLLESLVEYGFGGVLEHARGFGPADETDGSLKSLKDQGLTKAMIQQRANQLARELHTLERSDNVLRELGKRSKASAKQGGDANSKGAGKKGGKKQTALDAFFSKSSALKKKVVSDVVLLSDTEEETKENATEVSSSDIHVVEIEMSPKTNGKEPEGIRLQDDVYDNKETGAAAGEKREGDDAALETPASPEKKLRTS